MHQNERIGVVIIVLKENNQTVLLGERMNAYKAGMYGLPGGRIELKESLVAAAQREMHEETGIEADKNNLEYLGVIREFQETHNFIDFVFVLKNPSHEPQNKEPNKCKGWEWISLKNLPKNILRGHQAAINLWLNKTPYKDLL